MTLRTYIILLFCLFSLAGNSQQYENYIDLDKSSIIKNFNSLAKKNKEYSVETKDSASALYVYIKGFENIVCVFEFDEFGTCIESSFTYSCSDCVKKHVDEFLNDKYYGWEKTDEKNYRSKYKRKQTMTLVEKTEEPVCFTIIFTKVYWTKEEYKKKTKK